MQPVHRRSPGTFSRRSARLLTEREPEIVEVPVARDLVEEPEVRRRYPRGIYHEYYEKREPRPEPVDVPALAVKKREEERSRVYPRRVYYEYYEKRALNPEPATKIKETSVTVTTKVSTFDTPQNVAAANSNQPISGGSVGTTESTLISTSQTNPSPASVATATGTTIVNTATGTATTATATATGAGVGVTGTGTSTTATSTTTGSVAPATDGTSTVTKSTVTATAIPSPVVSSTSSSAGATDTSTDTGSATISGAGDGSQPPTVDPNRPSGGTSSLVNVPRDVEGTTTEPLLKRRSAYSGATWASFVRRQRN